MILTIIWVCGLALSNYAFYKSGYYRGKIDGIEDAIKITDDIITERVYQKRAEIIQEYLAQEGIK